MNPFEELLSPWRWKVYDRQFHQRIPLLQAIKEAYEVSGYASPRYRTSGDTLNAA